MALVVFLSLCTEHPYSSEPHTAEKMEEANAKKRKTMSTPRDDVFKPLKSLPKTWKSLDDSLHSFSDLWLPDQEELGLLLSTDESDHKFRLSELNYLLLPELSLVVEDYFCEQAQPKQSNFSHPILSTWIGWYLQSIPTEEDEHEKDTNRKSRKKEHVNWNTASLRDALLLLQTHFFEESQITEDDLLLYCHRLTRSGDCLLIQVTDAFNLKVRIRSGCSVDSHSTDCLILSVTALHGRLLKTTHTMARVLTFAKQFFQHPRKFYEHIQKKLLDERNDLEAWHEIQSSIYDKYKPDEADYRGKLLYFQECKKAERAFKRNVERRVSDDA